MTAPAAHLADQLRSGDRRALAQAITLVESTRADHRAQAADTLDAVLHDTGRAIRVGISGTPGAGKSTMIEALGTSLTGSGHQVAVLAVDPSSSRTGGSILGDKTRMTELARDERAFIRPSPAGGHLGGVARRTREASLLCEAAGFDVIIIETVGVGQSEAAVADMVDCFVVLVAPGGGDELQGIKRGILELADLIVVNKADGDLRPAAERALADHRSVLQLLRPKHEGWTVPVLAASAIERRGIDEVWAAVERLHAMLDDSGRLADLRADQAVSWMWRDVRDRIVEDVQQDPALRTVLAEVEDRLRANDLSALSAAERLLAALRPAEPTDPEMTVPSLPRHHAVALILLTLAAVARGGYWVATLEVWSPVDEAQHFGYVESLATGDGVPTVGRDRLSDDVMQIAKASPTYFGRSRPFEADGDDTRWGAAAEQYEGIHGPTYYGLMVPAYWAGQAVHPLAALYAVRAASVLLAAAAVPLAWALARRLLPDRPPAWLLGPGLLVAVNGFTSTGATVSNDTLVITGSVVALLLAARATATRNLGPAALTGVAAGAVVVGKSTALGLMPLLALLVIVQLVNRRAVTERWLPRIVAAGIGAAAVIGPWLVWNLVTYDSISAAAAAEAITGSLQSPIEPGLDAIRQHWAGSRLAFWESGLLTGEGSYRRAWDLLTVALLSVGLVAAARRWRREETMTVGALAAAFPVAFLTMVALFFVVLGSSGLLLGRYVYVALIPLLLALGAAALAIAGARWAPTLVLGVAAFGLWSEIDLTDHYLSTTYERHAVDPALAPVVDQSWNDGPVRAAAVVIEVDCPVEVVEVGLEEPPETIGVEAADGVVRGTLMASVHTGFSTYALERPASGPLRVPVPPDSGVWVSATEREPSASLDGGSEDPLVRAWCRVGEDRAAEVRFAQTYDVQHPGLSRGVLRAWPRAWFGLALVLTGAAAVSAAVGAAGRRSTAPT